MGCQMVYDMLLEATDATDPEHFKETQLYRQCVEAGVIPADEADLNAHFISPETASSDSSPSKTLPLRFGIRGMWCPACAWVIGTALERLPGVETVACDFATDRLSCSYDPVLTTPHAIFNSVRKLGYSLDSAATAGKSGVRQNELLRLGISALLSANVMMLSWALYSGFFTSLSLTDVRFISWPILVMTTLVMTYGGGLLFRKAWWGIRHGAPGMEALVCMGAGCAYIYSLINFISGSWHLYFDTAAMLITLVLLGKFLEANAKANVRRDLEGFLALQPNKVRLVTADLPQGRFVTLAQLAIGDRFRVVAGEMVAADGRVVSGAGTADVSAVTGESRPLSISVEDSIVSGTTLTQGEVVVEARRVGRESMLGEMIAIIERGLAQRTSLESRSDRWLALFVPVIAGLAVATGAVGWILGLTPEQAFVRGLTVMVIACPCALGIAVPLARIAGISKAGRLGILVRDFEAFERSSQVDEVVFDKTGTLTDGRWFLKRVVTYAGMTEGRAIALAAGLEAGVDHTVARVLEAYARDKGMAPEHLVGVQVGPRGVQGEVGGRWLKLGARDFALSMDIVPRDDDIAEGLLSKVYLSIDGKHAATFFLGDGIKDDSVEMIRSLKAGGYKLHLISGDADGITQEVARTLAIPQAKGDLLPREKAALVDALQAGNHHVAMVGDGINDAPALANAHLSVAVHRDAALSQQAAAVTLMRGNPIQLLDFFALSRRVNSKVGQNLALAWIYNLVGVPIAMSGLLNPLMSATAMLLSSLTVIGNTLLLVRQK
jgi:heavy metal translocating P-type ATPase